MLVTACHNAVSEALASSPPCRSRGVPRLTRALATTVAGLGVLAASAAAAGPLPPGIHPSAGTSFLSGVSCFGTSRCWGVGSSSSGTGVVVPLEGGVPGLARAVPATYALTGVACPRRTTCVAVGETSNPEGETPPQGVVVAINDGVPGAAQVIPSTSVLNGVACPTRRTCLAVGASPTGQGALVAVVAGTAGPARAVAGTDQLQGVACPTARTCWAVGQAPDRIGQFTGVVVPAVSGQGRGVQAVPGTFVLSAIACSHPAACEAVGDSTDGRGAVVSIANGIPATRHAVENAIGLTGVACPSAATCDAVGLNFPSPAGAGRLVVTTNGIPRPAEVVAGTELLAAVACPTDSTCQAVGSDPAREGVVATITTPSARAAILASPALPAQCPRREPANVPANRWAAAQSSLAPTGASTIRLCRYTGLSGHPRLTLARSSLHTAPKLVARLQRALNGLPPKGIQNFECIRSDRSLLLALLAYPGRHAVTIAIPPTGCPFVTNGDLTRRITSRLLAELTRLTGSAGPVYG